MQDKFKSNMTAPILTAISYIMLIASKVFNIAGRGGANEYLSVIVLQLLIFLVPATVYSKLRGEGYVKKLRLRPIGAEQIVLALVGALALICGSLLLNILYASGLSDSEFSLYDTFRADHNGTAESFIYVTLAYAAVPAICEEFFFRSVLCAEYEKYGIGAALIMSSLMFGLIHFNFGQLVIYLFAGIVLFLTFYATRSVVGSIIVHFVYNMYGLFAQKFANEVYRTTGSTELFLLFVATLFIISIIIFCAEASRLYRRYSASGKESDYLPEKVNGDKKTQIAELLLAPPCLICYLAFVLVTVLT